MKQIKRITLRLSLDKQKDKAVADFLSQLDKSEYRTVNNAIKTILYSFIKGSISEKSDTSEIISVIRSTIEAEMTRLFSSFVSDNTSNNILENQSKISSDDDIDMGFIGE